MSDPTLAPADPLAERDARRAAARAWNPPKFDPPHRESFDRLGLDYRRPAIPPPPTRPPTIDCHTHLLAARHAATWFETADVYGVDHTITMTPLEEAIKLVRGPFGQRVTLIAVPDWAPGAYDEEPFWRRVDAYHNLGCRVVKFHLAPGTMAKSGLYLGSEQLRRYVHRAIDRGMVVMTHIGDPQPWYDDAHRYGGDPEFWGTRQQHYDAWEALLDETRGSPWWGAHLGGYPEDLPRLARMFDSYPDLMLDLSATKWIVRALAGQRDAAREFVIAYQDRLMWGSDQVSQDGRDFDFLASRWWAQRKLWETAYVGESPIADPDAPNGVPQLRGLALPTDVLQKLYRDNVVRFLSRVGVALPTTPA